MRVKGEHCLMSIYEERETMFLDAVKQGPASAYVRRVTADPRDVKGIESSFDVV